MTQTLTVGVVSLLTDDGANILSNGVDNTLQRLTSVTG